MYIGAARAGENILDINSTVGSVSMMLELLRIYYGQAELAFLSTCKNRLIYYICNYQLLTL